MSEGVRTDDQDSAWRYQYYTANHICSEKDTKKLKRLVFILHHHLIEVFCVGVLNVNNYHDKITDQ